MRKLSSAVANSTEIYVSHIFFIDGNYEICAEGDVMRDMCCGIFDDKNPFPFVHGSRDVYGCQKIEFLFFPIALRFFFSRHLTSPRI
jgi:hypothetical protein